MQVLAFYSAKLVWSVAHGWGGGEEPSPRATIIHPHIKDLARTVRRRGDRATVVPWVLALMLRQNMITPLADFRRVHPPVTQTSHSSDRHGVPRPHATGQAASQTVFCACLHMKVDRTNM